MSIIPAFVSSFRALGASLSNTVGQYVSGLGIGTTLATAATVAKATLKAHTLPEGSYFHGTTEMAHLKPGDTLVVDGHLFITRQYELARSYGGGSGTSALRPGESTLGKPGNILHLEIEPGTKAYRGLFGFHPYLPHGTEVKVKHIEPVKLSHDELEQATREIHLYNATTNLS